MNVNLRESRLYNAKVIISSHALTADQELLSGPRLSQLQEEHLEAE